MANEQKRVAERFPVTLFIGNANDSIPLGRSRNVSLSGVFVETKTRPELNTTLEIWFVWGEEVCSCTARVVRHAEDGVGLTFIDPEALFIRALQEMTGLIPEDATQLER